MEHICILEGINIGFNYERKSDAITWHAERSLNTDDRKVRKNGTRNKNSKGKPSGTKEAINGKDL